MTGAARSIDIRNSDGLSLADEWGSGPRSYLGLMVAGFPNMYLITGPQSPSVKSQMILASEHHVDIIAGIVQTMRAEGHRSVEAVAEAQEEWVGHANEVAVQNAGNPMRPPCAPSTDVSPYMSQPSHQP